MGKKLRLNYSRKENMNEGKVYNEFNNEQNNDDWLFDNEDEEEIE